MSYTTRTRAHARTRTPSTRPPPTSPAPDHQAVVASVRVLCPAVCHTRIMTGLQPCPATAGLACLGFRRDSEGPPDSSSLAGGPIDRRYAGSESSAPERAATLTGPELRRGDDWARVASAVCPCCLASRVNAGGRHGRLFVCTLSPGALASSSRAERATADGLGRPARLRRKRTDRPSFG